MGLEELFEQLQAVRQDLVSAVIYAAVHFHGIPLEFKCVLEGRLPAKTATCFHLEETDDVNHLLSASDVRLTYVLRQQNQIMQSCRLLLILGISLFSLVAALLFCSGPVIYRVARVLLLLSSGLLSLTFVILLNCINGQSEGGCELRQSDVTLDKCNFQKSMLNRNLQLASNVECRSQYLTSLFNTSRFFFATATFLIGMAMVIHGLWTSWSIIRPAVNVQSTQAVCLDSHRPSVTGDYGDCKKLPFRPTDSFI